MTYASVLMKYSNDAFALTSRHPIPSFARSVAEEMNRLRNRGRSVSNDGVNRELAHRQRSFAHAQERLSQASRNSCAKYKMNRPRSNLGVAH